MTDTGLIIRMLRKRLRWTRVRLSEKSGVPVNTITSVESNRDCRVSTFERLVEAMGYEMEVLQKEL